MASCCLPASRHPCLPPCLPPSFSLCVALAHRSMVRVEIDMHTCAHPKARNRQGQESDRAVTSSLSICSAASNARIAPTKSRSSYKAAPKLTWNLTKHTDKHTHTQQQQQQQQHQSHNNTRSHTTTHDHTSLHCSQGTSCRPRRRLPAAKAAAHPNTDTPSLGLQLEGYSAVLGCTERRRRRKQRRRKRKKRRRRRRRHARVRTWMSSRACCCIDTGAAVTCLRVTA